MKKLLGKRRLIFAAVTVMALAIASLGYAAWTSAGNGSGVAKASTAQALTTVTATASSASLYPGATADLTLQVSNPNPYPITVTDVTGNGTITADASHSTCGQDATSPDGRDLHRPAQPEHRGARQRDHSGGGEQRRPDEQRLGQQLPGRDVHHPGEPERGQLRLLVPATPDSGSFS